MGLFVLALFTHPLIDIFTVYGTQLFAPFSLTRVAWNALAIIDPFYSGILVAGLAAGLAWRRRPPRVRAAGFAALGLSWSYMFYGVWLNDRAESDVRAALVAEGRTGVSVRAYPTILQPYLRRVVAHDGDEVLVGLYTPFRPGEPVLQAFREPDHPLIDALARTPEGSLFVWFAMGEVTARVREGRERFVVEIDDLRYGVAGRPNEGMWGVRGVFDARGRLLGAVRRTYRDRADAGFGLGGLWDAMWGDFSALGMPSAPR